MKCQIMDCPGRLPIIIPYTYNLGYILMNSRSRLGLFYFLRLYYFGLYPSPLDFRPLNLFLQP